MGGVGGWVSEWVGQCGGPSPLSLSSPPSPSQPPHHPQPQPLIAHDHASLRAFFLTHQLFPILGPSPAASAADKAPGGRAVRALIAVGDAGWMRRQR